MVCEPRIPAVNLDTVRKSMKYLSALAIAATLALGGAAAFAADKPATASATTMDHSQKACEKAADDKNLTGEARTKAIKECREVKK
jgi:hypothetical protein